MQVLNPDWIFLAGASPAIVERATTEHATLKKAIRPRDHRAAVVRITEDQLALTFSPSLPVSEFLNLLLWLGGVDSRTQAAVCGWVTCSEPSARYQVIPDLTNHWGDTALARSINGELVEIYVPETRLCTTRATVPAIAEPRVGRSPTLASFSIVSDAATESNPNPEMRVTDKSNNDWR